MTARNHAFDLLCGVCIVRMVMLHIMQFTNQVEQDWWKVVMEWSFFFMSFFFFKAGYFNKSVSGDSRAYFLDRVKRLFIPYLTCGLLADLVYFAFLPFLMDRYHKPVEPLEWSHIWDTSSFYGNAPDWFLFSFFVSYLVVHFLEKIPHLHWVVLSFPLLSYLCWLFGNPLWMSLDNLFMGVFFFYLGRLWGWLMRTMDRRLMCGISCLMVVAFAVGNVLWHGEYTMSSNRFTGDFIPTMANTVLILCGLSGLLLTVHLPRIPVLCYIGQHSMVYFLCHYPLLYIWKFTHLSFGHSIYGHADEAILLAPVIFALCTWFVPYFEKVPWLSGRFATEQKAI